MRIALISDIHGNVVALDAVLADCAALGVDSFWFLGDYAAFGPEPVAVLERVANLANSRFIRGNTDRYLVTGENPGPSMEDVRSNPELIETYSVIATSLAWTRGSVTTAGWVDWLADLPLDLRFTAPDVTRILAVHAAPGSDDGEGIHPGLSNSEIASLTQGSDADVVFVAHTHEAMVRQAGNTLVVNTGSLSNPRGADLYARYVLLDCRANEVLITPRRVAYDQAAFADIVRRSRYPAADHILGFQRGEHRGREPHADHTPIEAGDTVRVGIRFESGDTVRVSPPLFR